MNFFNGFIMVLAFISMVVFGFTQNWAALLWAFVAAIYAYELGSDKK